MSRCGECKLGCNEEGAFYCEENLGYEQCIDRLQDALYAADRPRGEWTRSHEDTIAKGLYCSNCGKYGYGEKFCPNCGAYMKGVINESIN